MPTPTPTPTPPPIPAYTPAGLPPATRGALLEGMERIYRELAEDVARAGPVCILRGVCCDFATMDYVLYASSLEVLYLGCFIDLARVRDAGKLCPFWLERRCSEHAVRPLGCRVYFCDPRYAAQAPEIYERHHRRIRELADRLELDYEYAPFLDFLARAGGRAATPGARAQVRTCT
ncbi:MAG: hypothetical protein HZA54_05525 [Planctomycetes bacterium]|nr:hypothetical protein [Planctomycetota bacterium]